MQDNCYVKAQSGDTSLSQFVSGANSSRKKDMDILKCLAICSLLYGSNCLLLDENLRKVDKTLTVSNGDAFGAWTTMELCPPESYAIGYDMKVWSSIFTFRIFIFFSKDLFVKLELTSILFEHFNMKVKIIS